MINIFEVNETNKMIEQENLDVRTITMGISLLDCIDSDLQQVNRKVYEKITTLAKNLVETGEEISKEYGIPVVNKRISGELGEKKGINVPNVKIKLPAITEKDKNDIIFGISQDIDFIAASFIRNAAGVNEIRKILTEHHAEHIAIIAKIENREGVDNIDEIIKAADGIILELSFDKRFIIPLLIF